MARLELDNVTVAYGSVTVLPGLSLAVAEGECIALLGPSGCGKTTTLRAVAGFVSPSAGQIRIGGRDVRERPPHKRNVGLVFQDYALFPHMTVSGNVAYGLQRRGVPKPEIATRVAQALAMVRLSSFGDRYPSALSGGQRQRVALARALVIEPDILLLDEPLGALDRKLRDEMQFELKTLQERLGVTCIIVTHDQEEALSLASRVALMFDGDIEEIGPPSQLYHRPGSARGDGLSRGELDLRRGANGIGRRALAIPHHRRALACRARPRTAAWPQGSPGRPTGADHALSAGNFR
jgi:ABC-type Fe3+/spermidine/putrescine transport system ATPase subunit